MHKHEPDIFAQVAVVLLPAAYLNFWLTGATRRRHVRQWGHELAGREGQGMQVAQMPTLVEGCDSAGDLAPESAAELHLSVDVIVVGGAGDAAAAAAAAAACGIGACSGGDGCVSPGARSLAAAC